MNNDILKKLYYRVLFIGIPLILGILLFLFFYNPNYGVEKDVIIKGIKEEIITPNTVRISGENFYETTIAISQTVYPATFEDNKPNAVILVRDDKKTDAIQAARIIHHPIDAPILYINSNNIPKITLDEIKRLDPQGIFVDGNRKVILIGDIEESVIDVIRKEGWKYRHIEGSDPFTLGKNISDYIAEIHGDHRDVVMIASIDEPDYGFVQGSWNAHMGDGFFFVERDTIPEKTIEALEDRYGDAYIYILGKEPYISEKVREELGKYGHVQEIPKNDDIYSQSVAFAGFKDIGKNFGWWIDKKTRDFGWGISEAGHNLIFANPKEWQSTVAASVLSHRGKHGPLILVSGDELLEGTSNYIKLLQPKYISPQEQVYNHGWIIGSTDLIPKKLQIEIDGLLQYKRGEGNE